MEGRHGLRWRGGFSCPGVRLLCLLSLTLAAVPLSGFADGEQTKIGISVQLSGGAATYGADIRNAFEYAASRYGRGKYRLIIEDDQCDGRTAVSVAQKLTRMDKVRYVLGFGCSGALLSAAPIYNKAKTVAIGVYTSSPRITDAGEYIFRTVPSDTLAAKPLYDHVRERYRRIGAFFEETDFAQDFRRAFEQENRDDKLEMFVENFLPATDDFRTQLLKMKAMSVEALLLIPQAEKQLVTLVKQARALGWKVPMYSHVFPSSAAFLREAVGEAEGMVYTDLPVASDCLTDQGMMMYREFVEQYGEPQSNAMSFVTSLAAFSALHEAIQSGTDVREYLNSSEFSTVLKRYRFDKNGDVVGLGFSLRVIRNGQPAPLGRQ